MHKAPAHSWLILVLILLAIGGGAYVYSNPDMFEGRFSVKPGDVKIKTPTSISTTETVATIQPKGGSVTTQTMTLSELDFDAVDDADNPLDAYDQRWVTVGYWEVDMKPEMQFCNWEGANNISIGLNDGTGSIAKGMGDLADDSRLVLRDKTGKTIATIEDASQIGSFYPTTSLKDDFQIQFDLHLKETAEGYTDADNGMYLGNLCVYNSEHQYTYDKTDVGGQNKYFTRKEEKTGVGLKGGILKIVE